MTLDITITDPDRKLDFSLAVDCRYREPVRPRSGWQDGGEPGEPAVIEIDRALCLEIVVWCGDFGIAAMPGHASDGLTESQLGAWCLQQYADEIECALHDQLHALREAVAI